MRRFDWMGGALAALVTCLGLAQAVPVAGQATVTAVAELPLASPTGAGSRNLSFGTIVPTSAGPVAVTVPAAVAPSSASVHSGEFRLDVGTLRGVSVTVDTPNELMSAAASMPVDYNGAEFGAWCVDADAGCTLTAFNPATTDELRVCWRTVGSGSCHPIQNFPPGSVLSIYIGGALHVAPVQRAGTYTGTITLSIVQVY
ncbi:MAG TPA: DUF4402 domain-containing protein [Longimicrobiales bacterium]|nr:DUF4402 domain-containing protein [Longimicrobiales bacterium]